MALLDPNTAHEVRRFDVYTERKYHGDRGTVPANPHTRRTEMCNAATVKIASFQGASVLLLGENMRVTMWDLRTPAETEAAAAATFEHMVEGVTFARTTKVKFLSGMNLLAAHFGDYAGVSTFDIRKPGTVLQYYDYHTYPVTTFDVGENFNESVALSGARNEVRALDLRLGKAEQKGTPIPQPSGMISRVRMVSLRVVLTDGRRMAWRPWGAAMEAQGCTTSRPSRAS